MAIIKNYSDKHSIEWEINLKPEIGLIYDATQEDYNNWVPYEFRLKVDDKIYIPTGISLAFSFYGFKYFMKQLQYLVDEKEEYCRTHNITMTYGNDVTKKSVDIMYSHPVISFCGEDNEFTIYLQNVEDYFPEEIVDISLWINAGYLEGTSGEYSIGFKFMAKYNDIKIFMDELQKQFKDIVEKED